MNDLENRLALEAIQDIGHGFTVSVVLDIAKPETITNFALFGKALAAAYEKGRTEAVSKEIHYPEHWDTAAYPTLADAMNAVYHDYKCSQCEPKVDCHKCQGNSITHSVMCPLYDKQKEQESVESYRAGEA